MCLCPKTVGGVPLVFFTCVWYEIIVQTEVCCYNNTCSDVWQCFSNEESARPLEMRNVMAPRNSIVLNLLPPGYQNKNTWKLHLKKTVNILYHCTWKMISDENWAQSLGQQFPLNFNRDCLLAFILEIEVFWRVWQIVWIQQSKLWNWIVQGNPRWNRLNRRHGAPSEKGRGAHTHMHQCCIPSG